MSHRSKVSIVRAPTYDHEIIYNAVAHAINLVGGIGALEERGKKILLKPNMLSGADPSRAVTTHPAFFEAVIIFLKEKGFTLFAGDSPGLESTASAGKKCGLHEIAAKQGINWVDFAESVYISNPAGKMVKKFTIAKIFTEVDSVVNLPKLKTHSQMYYTGALKNIYGMISGLEKARLHVRFPERDRFARMIVDLDMLIKPSLSIMDSVVAMEGPGPNNGYPVNMGLVIASCDPLALDTVACRIVGYDPEKIPILAEAFTREEWISSPDMIDIAGENIDSVMMPHFKKLEILKGIAFPNKGVFSVLSKIATALFVPRPVFNRDKCILCMKCTEICQAKALSLKTIRGKKYIDIDTAKCIRCYCCHELCPADAIDLKKRLI